MTQLVSLWDSKKKKNQKTVISRVESEFGLVAVIQYALAAVGFSSWQLEGSTVENSGSERPQGVEA